MTYLLAGRQNKTEQISFVLFCRGSKGYLCRKNLPSDEVTHFVPEVNISNKLNI